MRITKQIDFESAFTEDEKEALAKLAQRGFQAFTAVRLEDVRELEGKRRRTFSHRGKYDLALVLKTVEDSEAARERVVARQKEATEYREQEIADRVKAALEAVEAEAEKAMAEVNASFEGVKTAFEEEIKLLKEQNASLQAEVDLLNNPPEPKTTDVDTKAGQDPDTGSEKKTKGDNKTGSGSKPKKKTGKGDK